MRTILFSPPDITEFEIKEVAETLKSGWITTGPRTKQLENKIARYCNVNKAVCLNSATACMELTLRLLGIGKGDEVIVPAYTYTATASPVYHVGAKIVMVDSQKNSVEMDYDKLERAINENTKAIIPADLGGIICDYDKILKIVKSKQSLFQPDNDIQEKINRVVIIADAAHAFGAEKVINGRWKKCGEIADFTSFSFHAVKNLTTAEGGALTWKPIKGIDDEWIYSQFMLMSLHGQSKDALAKTQLGSWEYDIISPAYKCNMTDIMAAIGLIQLDRYPEMLRKRESIVRRYDKALENLGISVRNHYSDVNKSSGHLYMIRIPNISETERNIIIKKLAEEGVATNVHYKPLPMMTGYMRLGFSIDDYSNAYNQYSNEITLPLNTKMNNEDVEYVIEKVTSILTESEVSLYDVEKMGRTP